MKKNSNIIFSHIIDNGTRIINSTLIKEKAVSRQGIAFKTLFLLFLTLTSR
ncbi:hypothetical protein HPP_0390 [Hydrangea phyllody phytoplasma]|uniref:Uncharacterized protein n=2 Tax=16SrI (Aster yellows group) TaxID=3042590 RepID=A0ABQ5PSW8_9MOLU|nr:hypothetical protein [Hydrangea phyllody phytoplasma]GFZ75081.1 hypothetical protein HPP_0390 [Hydrangea phyllody phytoplasma]GLH61077.1 hypothetical protein RHYP_0220 [Rhus yellows phytoplasma]GLH61961.1 hypothetical protein HP2P_3680 [Hydrangea phyllody phytoplasma]